MWDKIAPLTTKSIVKSMSGWIPAIFNVGWRFRYAFVGDNDLVGAVAAFA